MKYRALGNTGFQVSEVAMGSEGFEGKNFEEVKDMIETCIEYGINFFDLYNPNPETRKNIGKALAGRRKDFIIQGHICSAWQDNQYLRTREIDLVKESFDNLLRSLETDYIDVGMIHYVDKAEDLDVVLQGPVIKYVLDLKTQGIIKSIGISTHSAEIALKLVESGYFEVIMFSINPAYDMLPGSNIIEDLVEKENYADGSLRGIDPIRELLYTTCEARGIALTVMKPFAGGMLLDEKKSPFDVALTPLQCLHYALTRPAVAAVMSGCFSSEQIRDVVRYCDCTEEEKDYSITLGTAPRHSFTGKCMYCGHCAPCTVGIDIAVVNKFLDLVSSVSGETVPETVKDHYLLLEHHASECIECGICETNCPFDVRIIEKMSEAAEVFGVQKQIIKGSCPKKVRTIYEPTILAVG